MTVRSTGTARRCVLFPYAALAATLLTLAGCSASSSAYGGNVLMKSGPSVLDTGDAALEAADDGLDILQQYLNNVLD